MSSIAPRRRPGNSRARANSKANDPPGRRTPARAATRTIFPSIPTQASHSPKYEDNHGEFGHGGQNAHMHLVCGEALIDLVGQGDGTYLARPGGGPANTAVTLGRLGVPVALAARFARDPFGLLLRRHLEQSAVDLRPSREGDDPTTLAVATADEQGQAQYSFYWQGTADWQWRPGELPRVGPEVTT